MIDRIVRYLRGENIPFRLHSYPSPEHEPIAVDATPSHAVRLDTRLFLVGGRLVMTVFPYGREVDHAALENALGAAVTDAGDEELPADLRDVEPPIPPLGQLFGIPIVADERVTRASVLVFQAFGGSDYFEIPYDAFARLEQPRVASICPAGELGPAESHAPVTH
jgi:hypothetical protein